MKTSKLKIAILLGVLMAFLAGRAYADDVSMTISVINADGTMGPSITLTDKGGINANINGDDISEIADVGVTFSGYLPGTDIYTSTSIGLIENPSNGYGTGPNASTLAMDIINAGCGAQGSSTFDCTNSQLVISLTDNGASVPIGQAIFSGTLGTDTSGGQNVTTGSNVSVQSSVLTDGNLYNAFTPTTATGVYTNATSSVGSVGQGQIPLVTSPYSINSVADINFTTTAGNASFELDAEVNGCADSTCGGAGALTGTPVNTPEPTSLLLLGSSLVGMGLLRKKYRLPL